MIAATLQLQFQEEYRRETWQTLLPQLLPGVELFAHAHDFPLTGEREQAIATARRQFGVATLADGKRIAFYEIEVAPGIQLLSNRVGLRNLIARCIDEVSAHAVLAFFVQPGLNSYRLTYAAKESTLNVATLAVETQETATRRFTYILGPGESCRTAADRLAGLPASAKLSDLTDAFSVEKLNKDFFRAYCGIFDLVAAEIRENHPSWSDEIAEQEAQTLLNRLLFLYFIQRKGWLDRDRRFLPRRFQEGGHAAQPDATSYIDSFLRPVFKKLSTPGSGINVPGHDLPFLNGGLFADEAGAEQRDDAIRRRHTLCVRNRVFARVFDDLLDIYAFTIHEESPLDQEVAVDPEMLGRIFESLVLQIEQSGTGGKSSRHDTGSFYTPRAIVRYLCREALAAWLETLPAFGKGRQTQIRALLALDASNGLDERDLASLRELLSPDEADAILTALDNLRACDPAVGSGAFPIGLLHELVNLARLAATRARGKDPVEADSHWLFDTKTRFIERAIYGVDLQARAIEICKLRLWLSLVVDYPLDVDPADCSAKSFRDALRKLPALPNLDFKIRRANSLIDMIHGEPVNLGKLHDSNAARPALNRLSAAKLDFFHAESVAKKRDLQLVIFAALAELAELVLRDARNELGLVPDERNAERVAELERARAAVAADRVLANSALHPKARKAEKESVIEELRARFEDTEKPTFVWQLDFAEIFHRGSRSNAARDSLLPDKEPADNAVHAPSGFDLVLANPPYVRQEMLSGFKAYFQNNYEAFDGTADLYVFFMEAGVRLLCDGGILSLIVSNSFLRAGYGTGLRRVLKKRSAVLRIVDFGGVPVFENAKDTYVCLPLIAKQPKQGRIEVCQIASLAIQDLSAYVAANRFTIPHERLTDEAWSLKSDVEAGVFEKIMKAGKPLGEFLNRKMFYGIKTGLNEAFELSDAERAVIVAETPASSVLIKPFLGGQDIRRYYVEDNKRFLIVIPCGWTRPQLPKGENGKPVATEREAFDWLAREHPAVARHLRSFAAPLKKRQDQGDYWWELRPCDYYDHLDAPKIVFPDICKAPRFALDRTGIYLANTAYCLGSDSLYLLGILNSRLFWFAISNLSIPFGIRAGEYRYRLIYQYMEKVPIHVINTADASERAEQKAIEGLVEQVLASKRADPAADTTALERGIDERVYRLYGLTPKEIKLVEATAK